MQFSSVYILAVLLSICCNSFSTHAQFPGAGNAIDFQNNREIIAPTGADLNPTDEYTDLTIEAWIYWRDGNLSGIMEGRPGAVHFETRDNNDPGRIRVRVHDNDALQVNNVLDKNEWVHLAFVYSHEAGSEGITLYKNGEEVGFRAGSMGGASRNFSSVLRFGISCCNSNSARSFNGLIDEIRVWYKAKTAAEIREQMCKKLTLPQTDSTLYYRLDQIVNDTVFDLSGNNNHGSLNNINPATHLVTSGAPIGDDSDFWHGVAFGGNTYYHQSNFGDSLSVSNITGNPDGLHIYSVDGLPNTLTGTSGVGSNAHYYGVFMANDNASFDATYHYGSNPAFLASQPTLDENDIVLYNRGNNASNLWINSGASPVVANQTITTNNTFRQEYIIGLENGEALPIELSKFNAIPTPENQTLLTWTTVSERNNDYFTLERSADGYIFEEIATLDGAGNSVQEIDYEYTYKFPLSGVSYYRLKQTDFDGTYSYSDIMSVQFYNEEEFSVFPNPIQTGQYLTIKTNKQDGTSKTYKTFSYSGQLVYQDKLINDKINISINPGSYLLWIEDRNKPIKLVVK